MKPPTLQPASSEPWDHEQEHTSSKLYPTVDMPDVVENLFPDTEDAKEANPSALPGSREETLITIPGVIVNLIDKDYSAELAHGDLKIVRLLQEENVVAVFVRVTDDMQWPLARDEAVVKLDDSHYFFSLRIPQENHGSDSSDEEGGKNVRNSDNVLNYGLTIVSSGSQRDLLDRFDEILKNYSCFSTKEVSVDGEQKGSDLLNDHGLEISSGDLLGKRCAAYWTALAPNVEDYSSTVAKMIADGSGRLIKGILWCGDVTADSLKRGNEIMKKRIGQTSDSKISPTTMQRIQRVKRMTKMTERVMNGVLSGVIKVSGFFTSSVANSKVGKKFFGLLPGEIIIASLDGFNKICDAVEVAGRNVMSTSSVVTTELVSQRYGEQAGEATNTGLGAAVHAFGTAWAAFKIRKALNPKSVLKPTALVKSAAKSTAVEYKVKSAK